MKPVSRKPVGAPTRGTTNPNRLRRVDRFLCGPLASVLRSQEAPTVVDLGFGASAITPSEMADRLRRVNEHTRVLGLEIDPERVTAARPYESENLRFLRGGFEVPLPAGWLRPSIIRAANVLRQYDETEVPQAWAMMVNRLAPDGVLVEGTCDELGRRGCWVTIDANGPRWLTILLSIDHLERPSRVADRLPKVLIHRNVPGERIHDLLAELDHAWDQAAPLSAYGVRQRWLACVRQIDGRLHDAKRWRLGELTVPWERVAPRGWTLW